MPSVEWIGAHGSNYTAGRGGRKVDTIGIHYTATNASARNNGVYFSRANANASAHYFIDGGGTVIQSVSEADTAWALGDWDSNQRAISIEVVSAGQDFTASEISELRWLVRDIMARYGIPASRVIRHYDVTGKRCPAPYVDASKWAKLRKEITRKEETEEKEEDMPITDEEIERIARRAAELTRSEILGYINPQMESVDVYQMLHDMPQRVWGYQNERFEKVDAYQILRDTRDATAKPVEGEEPTEPEKAE